MRQATHFAALLLLLTLIPALNQPDRTASGPGLSPGGRPEWLLPRPTEINALDYKKQRRQFKQDRKEYLESLHRAAPGTDWRALDARYRETRREQALQFHRQNPDREQVTIPLSRERELNGHWVEKGSNNLSGRMLTAAVDQATGTIWAGSQGGNLWSTGLDGENWQSHNDWLNMNSIRFVRHLVQADTAWVFVAKSDKADLYRSHDAGATWEVSTGFESVHDWGSLQRVVLQPGDTPKFYALALEWDWQNWHAVTSLYGSTDLGGSFTRLLQFNESGSSVDMVCGMGPDAPIRLLLEGTLYQLNDLNGLTPLGTLPTGFDPAGASHTLLTCGNDGDTDFLFAAISLNGNTTIFRSLDGGAEWEERGSLSVTPFTRNSFGCSLTDPDHVWFGAVEAWRSADGGSSWDQVNAWWEYYDEPETLLHADIPEIRAFPDGDGGEFQLICTDGGLYISQDHLQTVQNLSLTGLRISQYYSVYTNRFETGAIFAGSQDQGFQRALSDPGGIIDFEQTISGDYAHIVSGNGGYSLWSVYPGFAMYYPDILNSTDMISWTFQQTGSLWLPPLCADPWYPNRVWLGGGGSAGGAHIWQLDAGNFQINATEHPYDFSDGENGINIAALAISPLDDQRRFVITNQGTFFQSEDGGNNWTRTLSFQGPEAHYFHGSSIIPSPLDPATVWIGGSGYSNPPVYASTDGGMTFSALDQGLPPTLVYEMSVRPEGDYLFAATEVGPFVCDLASGDWFDLVQSVGPDQTWWSVDYVPAIQTVRFGTYGRGIWDFVLEDEEGVLEPAKPQRVQMQATPNPFNRSTTIGFTLDRPEFCRVSIYNLQGALVSTLQARALAAGTHRLSWQGADDRGVPVASGVYVCRVQTRSAQGAFRVTLLK